MTRFATLDIGTNTVLMLVAEARGGQFVPVVERGEITRLGRGVDLTRRLDPAAMDQTVAALSRFADEARALGVAGMACVATSAARDAQNGEDFLGRVRRDAGIVPEIISGDLEALLSYEAARRDLGAQNPLVVLDIGAGSTELVFGESGRVTFERSFDLGSVRLTERHVRGDPPSAPERREIERALDEAFAPLPAPPAGFTFVGVAGTVTTLCAVARGIDSLDPTQVHLARLSSDEVRRTCDRLFALPLAERKKLPGMPEKRADVIAAGSLVLERALARLGATGLVVSDHGLRWGLLYHRFGAALAPT